MSRPQLLIGNKNYSSWSLRPWLLLRHFEVDFEERRLPLDTPEFRAEIAKWTPSLRVPVLRFGDQSIWDSLAICEAINERWLSGAGWPDSRSSRALARAVSCEMHSGFAAMRNEMPMNLRRDPRPVQLSESAQADCTRVQAIWSDCLQRSGGPWLFGGFSIADAFYAPVVWRFRSYAIATRGAARHYSQALLVHPAMRAWQSDALAESERLPQDDL